MEVYVEVIYIVHFLITLLSLENMTILLQINPSTKSIIKNTFIFSSTYFFIYLDANLFIVLIGWFILFLIVYQKQLFLYFPTFMILYFTIVYFICSLSPSSFIYNGLLMFPMQISILGSFMIVLLFTLSTVMYFIYCKKKISSMNYMYPIQLTYQGNTIYCNALLDSGNEMYYEGYPLILFSKRVIEDYQKITTLYSNGVIEQVIDIIVIERCIINDQKLNNIYAGVINQLDYDCLLNKQLMGGII